MKKIVVVLVMLSLLVLPALAQTSFGLKGALSDYSWTGDGWGDVQDYYEFMYGVEVDNEFSFGFSIGGFIEHKVSSTLAIQPELLFTLASMQYGDGDDWIRETWKMLEIPVYLKGLFPLDQGSFYIMGGPDLFYLLGDIEIDTSNDTSSSDDDYDNNLLFGFAVSAGYEFQNGAFLGLKFSRVLTEYYDDTDLFIHGIGIEGGMKL
ncbi:hypothetical protein B4O97_10925 [Marispirochaeta aestuarii]|uniref:Outer membrane protein beta-barrel domain-containing protein n=1 Tax=Marispirochaeta aestuarii TaxID=1963862 RepID=A0A1Y1RY82_9SPIO|nr:outer membrane beta-barrel protein [Marispirochaeta aestuarii]ORC34843.1 hypothetical protein B4O97_10925 [Marispirochaeta aestuarii]